MKTRAASSSFPRKRESSSSPIRKSDELTQFLKRCWAVLRRLTGDDAYERYLAHHLLHHADTAPLDRAAFFKSEQQRKWEGVRRCC